MGGFIWLLALRAHSGIDWLKVFVIAVIGWIAATIVGFYFRPSPRHYSFLPEQIFKIMVGKVIVSCAGDSDLAKDLCDYLYSRINDVVVLVEDEIEIAIDDKAAKKAIAELLNSFVNSNAGLKGYSVIEFGNTFTVGIAIRPEKVGMHTCELCGYFTPYQAELYTHRMTHLGGFA